MTQLSKIIFASALGITFALGIDFKVQAQVTNVNQLRDVSPTDWPYEALSSLVDSYGCLAGFPDQTFRDSPPISRFEFAAGLNSCLNQIERLIVSSEAINVSSEAINREDLNKINRLVQEFEDELVTLGRPIDNFGSPTAFEPILFPPVDTPLVTKSVPEPSTTLALIALTGSGLFVSRRGQRKDSQKKSVA